MVPWRTPHPSCVVPAASFQTGDVLYLEHEIGGHWYILRSGKVGFYVSLRPLETNPDVIHMRTLRNEGYFGHMPLLLNILSWCAIARIAGFLTISNRYR